jgi:hypothetical protein
MIEEQIGFDSSPPSSASPKSTPVNRSLVAVSDRGLRFQSMAELIEFSKILARSQFVPKSLSDPADVFAALCFALELDLPPVTALQNLAVINGRVSMFGDLAKGLIDRSGLCEDYSQQYVGDPNSDDYKCVVRSKRRGRADYIESEFSVRDAKVAGLWDKKSESGKPSPWILYPKRMLMWRARAFNLRDNFPDILRGLPCAEEFEEYHPDDPESRFKRARPAREAPAFFGASEDSPGEEKAQVPAPKQPVEDPFTRKPEPKPTIPPATYKAPPVEKTAEPPKAKSPQATKTNHEPTHGVKGPAAAPQSTVSIYDEVREKLAALRRNENDFVTLLIQFDYVKPEMAFDQIPEKKLRDLLANWAQVEKAFKGEFV